MEVRLDGKVALVTGATQGVGAAIAEAAARSGVAGLLLTGRDATRGDAVAARITGLGPETEFVAAELADPDAPRGWSRPASPASAGSTSSSTPPA